MLAWHAGLDATQLQRGAAQRGAQKLTQCLAKQVPAGPSRLRARVCGRRVATVAYRMWPNDVGAVRHVRNSIFVASSFTKCTILAHPGSNQVS